MTFKFSKLTFNSKIKPVSNNVPLLLPLESIKNKRVTTVFKGYRRGALIENELNIVFYLYVLIMPRTRFRVNTHSMVA